MSAYYNEWEPYPAQWLRNLIAAELIAPGDVDERSIKDVHAEDIKKYTQCHFFAGIGGWSHALRLSNYPIDRPVWTGSCPCQPFSVAGKQQAQSDERHLWPVWFELIRECRPPTIFGEQVAGAIAHGWLDDVYKGLEAQNYAVGTAVLPACGVGAPHKRDRLWFVANTNDKGSQGRDSAELPECAGEQFIGSSNSPLADSESQRWGETRSNCERQTQRIASSSNVSNTNCKPEGWFAESRDKCDFWKFEPAVGRVANGIPARSHKLRAYGNAIVPQCAQAFIEAFMYCRP